jgi:hypothetical protein
MKDFLRVLAIVLLFINGLSAFAGGIGLIGDPGGQSLGWTTDMLASSPFDTFLIPGIILFAGNGILSVTTAVIVIKRMAYYPLFILFQGGFLCSWIIIQMMMLHFYHPLHLICGVVGVLLIVCGYTLQRGAPSRMAKH